MKTIRATPALQVLADKLPIDILADEADVQISVEDTPNEAKAAIYAAAAKKGKDCVVVFDFKGEHQLYFVGTAEEVADKLKDLGGR